MMKLSNAKVGREYRIVRINASGLIKRRILDLGLLPGLKIKVLRRAPLGDPIEVLVKGNPLTIRGSEADHIFVEEVES
jgi:Fe2+ transport system protein FeoA